MVGFLQWSFLLMSRYPEFFIQTKNKRQQSIYYAKFLNNLLESHEPSLIFTNKCPRETVKKK